MVGSVSKQGVPYALLRVDSLLYQVKAGDRQIPIAILEPKR